MLAIHAINKFQKIKVPTTDPLNTPDTFEDMTNAEVTTMSNDWYDAYVAGKE
jgi:hypothetical protein